MSDAPKIDQRTYGDIVVETEQLVQAFTDWQPGEVVDTGGTLIRTFSRMVEVAIARLNQVPEKNFLAFLDLIGTQIQPPQPARVPLTFLLAAGSPSDGFVPKGTRVAASPAEGEAIEIIFETDQDLVVTQATLEAVFVREPAKDRDGDYTQIATDLEAGSFSAFEGDRLVEHSLYLACETLFTLPAPKTITLTVYSPDAAKLAALPLVWSYWDQTDTSQELVVQSNPVSEGPGDRWGLVIPNLPVPALRQVGGVKASWVQARLDLPLPRGELTVLNTEGGQVYQNQRQNLLPEAAAAGTDLNAGLLDLTSLFSPLGEADPLTDFFLLLEEVFAFPSAMASLNLSLTGTIQASGPLTLQWQFWNGTSWQDLGESRPDNPSSGVASFGFTDDTLALTQDGAVRFQVPPQWQVREIAGRRGRWLRVHPIGNYGGIFPQIQTLTADYTWELPRIDRITATVSLNRTDLTPEFGFTNSLPLDFSKDFSPFGRQPRFNDTLYLAHREAFATAGATVTVTVTLSAAPPVAVNPSPDLAVVWEAFTSQGWQLLVSSPSPVTNSPLNFTTSGSFSFNLPDQMVLTTIQGEENYWIRARIARGNYGTEIAPDQITTYTTLRETASADQRLLRVNSVRGFLPNDEIWIGLGTVAQERQRIASIDIPNRQITFNTNLQATHPANTGIYLRSGNVFGPPTLQSIQVGYTYNTINNPLTACQTLNDFTAIDQTAKAAQQDNDYFLPFTPIEDRQPTLYLGFNRPFANRPTALYAQVEPPVFDEATMARERTTARLNWEYATATGWQRLGVEDETRAFAERGLLTFLGPQELAKSSQFDRELYWLRAIWQEGAFQVLPRLQCLRTNTTWASQAISIDQEILGSSNGNPHQVFYTTKTPVLKGQYLEVLEAEGNWVSWQSQPDFYGSNPGDRHYVMDYLTGEVRFGDGQNGAIPPQGRNNLRLTYRTGGGSQGNRGVGTILQLKTTVPYVDRVTNYEAAGGGSESGTLESVKEQGPKAIRHRERAVTVEDFEDLAYQASSEVIRAKAIPAQTPPEAGQVGLILVPNSDLPQPIPSLELLNLVEDYLRDRCDPTVSLWLTGPDWIEVTVTAEVAPVSWQAAIGLDTRVIDQLQKFLHPLTGGLDEQGWAFGRKPHKSDLYALIEGIEGVSYVRSLIVNEDAQGRVIRLDRFLVFSGNHAINLIEPN